MSNLTALELTALIAITNADFYENGRNSICWDYSVFDCLAIKGKTRSGVFGSLAKKGIIEVTEKMKKFFIDEKGKKRINKYWDPTDPDCKFGTIAITEFGYAVLDEAELIDEDGYFKE
jgi:hypothetical protein